MTFTPSASIASKIDSFAQQWKKSNKEKLRITNKQGTQTEMVRTIDDAIVTETATSVSYDRRAVMYAAEQSGIEEKDIIECHLHPNYNIHPSQTDIDNRKKQYIDSDGEKNEFRISVIVPQTGVRVEVAYDHSGKVLPQSIWWKPCDMITYDNQDQVKPLLQHAETTDLENVRFAIQKAEVAHALNNNFLAKWWNIKPESSQKIESLQKQVWNAAGQASNKILKSQEIIALEKKLKDRNQEVPFLWEEPEDNWYYSRQKRAA